MKKALTILLAFVLVLGVFAGCGQKPAESEQPEEEVKVEDTLTKELKQNDYRGGVQRTLAIAGKVVELMDGMKANNKVLREDNPNSFWTKEGYQDFVSTFLDIPIINDTQWLNEEESTFAEAIAQTGSQKNNLSMPSDDGNGYVLATGVTINRNEKDDYSIVGSPQNIVLGSEVISGYAKYKVLYDCDKDWGKAYTTLNIAELGGDITSQLFEFSRLDKDTFVVQTSRERMLVEFEPVAKDIDIRERKIRSFYYSKLLPESYRSTFKKHETLPETDSQGLVLSENIKLNDYLKAHPEMNAKGEIYDKYSQKDSIFFAKNTKEWIFEDKNLGQALVYEDGVLVATNFNKLSEKYERFIYALSSASVTEERIESLEELVKLGNVKETGEE